MNQAMVILVRDCFQEILNLEADLEVLRRELSYRRDFSLMSALNLFARSP